MRLHPQCCVRWLVGISLSVLAAHASAADLITAWNNALLEAIRTEDTPPCLAARNLAIVHGALYDASMLAAGERERAFLVREAPQKNCSPAAAANAAALLSARFVHPSHAANFDRLFQELRNELEKDGNSEAAEKLGRRVAQAWIDWRSADGTSKSLPYIPKTQPGAWRRTPPFYRPPDLPAWCLVQPFTLVGAAQFRPPGPPALSSARYAEDFNEVKRLGGAQSKDRSAEQTEIARFWSDFSYSVTPPGHWNQIAQEASAARNLPFSEKARLFALLNLTMADVGIACWEAKFFYNSWRPVTAIRAGDADENPKTEKESTWSSLLVTPSFPEYTSGHSAFSGAGAAILGALLGTDAIDFSVPSDTLPGNVRVFHSLRACAAEISQSRLYGGIHFPSALRDGLALGENIAAYVLAEFSQPEQKVRKIFSAPLEMENGFWLGGATTPGTAASVDRFADGRWVAWTNLVSRAPVIRWRAETLPVADNYRIVIR